MTKINYKPLYILASFILSFLVIYFIPAPVKAVLSDGLIDPSRRIDWSVAGLPQSYPDGEAPANPWTQPVRTTICATIAPMGSSSNFVAPTQILNAEAACAPGGVVQLAAGNFYLTSLPLNGSYPSQKSGITVRGAGADKTFVYLNGSVGLAGVDAPTISVTGGFTQGSTQLTLSSPVAPNTLIEILQCNTGFSGTPCSNATDSAVDNGGLWTCSGDGPWCSHGGTGNEGGTGQVQLFTVTASSGNTVTVTPPVYLPNWSLSNTILAYVFRPYVYGVGLEGITVDQTAATYQSYLSFCMGCWIDGVRFVNSKLMVGASEHYLIKNNYLADYGGYKDGYGITLMPYGFGDGLILNNILENLSATSDDTGTGAVYAYNYLANNGQIFNHVGSTAFNLVEGNQGGAFLDDNIHGNHNFSTIFRNWLSGASTVGYSIQLGQGTRFSNIIGNVLGGNLNQSYEYSPASFGTVYQDPIYHLGIGAALGAQGVPYDKLAIDTLFRWGNVTVYGGAVHAPSWSSSEVPSSLNAAVGYQQQIGTGNGSQTTFTGTLAHLPAIAPNTMVYDRVDALYSYDNGTGTLINAVSAGSINYSTGAVTVTFTTPPSNGSPVFVNYLQQTTNPSPYRNAVPASHTLPLSLIFPNLVAGTSGTNLPFGKVCINYTTSAGCGGTYYRFPVPGIGPDVTGGNGPGGYSYDIPGKVAWSNLPVDPVYQKSYSITGSSWANGVETLNVSVPPYGYMTVPVGEFDISGTAGCNGTKLLITSSTSTTVSYARASDPGSCAGGTFKFPNVRVFSGSVYQADVGGSATPLAGDLNSDHIVNSLDWSIMNSRWFTSDATADLNHDGVVNSLDWSIMNSNWFKTW